MTDSKHTSSFGQICAIAAGRVEFGSASMHRDGLVLLVLAHVARSEVVVSDFAALQNAIADGAVIRITSSFDWTGAEA